MFVRLIVLEDAPNCKIILKVILTLKTQTSNRPEMTQRTETKPVQKWREI